MSAGTQTEGLIVPDFSDTQDNVGEGTYSTRIIDSKVDSWKGKDGKKDTAIIIWTLETFNEADEKNNGRKIFHRTPIEGKGAFRLQDFYRAATGVECAGSFNRTDLHSCEVEVTLVPQREKPQYMEIKSVRPISH